MRNFGHLILSLLLTAAHFAAECIIPVDHVARDSVDTIELNHTYDFEGRPIFTQLILWQGDRVRAWRMVKDDSFIPRRDHARQCWSLLWQDGDVARQVQAAGFSESWTQYDPEVLDRSVLPAEQRRPLRKLKGK